MSTAHRPTWDPAQARDVKGGTRQFSVRDMAAHTKLKFRQPGQGPTSEVAKRDLKAELLAAEAEAKDKKRKALGLPSETLPALGVEDSTDEEANKRRKLLQEVIALDRNDSDEEMEDGKEPEGKEEEEEEEEDSDSEDDTEELLRELDRIKRERAAEKEKQEKEQNDKNQIARDEQIATANPLLNLAAALGHETEATGTGTAGTFAVKRRWDDDRVFANQAEGEKRPGHFINDLLRTEFHRKFMAKFIK